MNYSLLIHKNNILIILAKTPYMTLYVIKKETIAVVS